MTPDSEKKYKQYASGS
jgi:hypothetical protein